VLETNRKHFVRSLLISLHTACIWLSINYNSIFYTRNSVYRTINQEFEDQNAAIKSTHTRKQTPLHLPVPLYLNMVVHVTYMVIKLCTSCTGSQINVLQLVSCLNRSQHTDINNKHMMLIFFIQLQSQILMLK